MPHACTPPAALQNQEVEQQLRTQEQLQKLAAMVNSASDAAAAQQHQQEQQQQPQPTQSGGTGATATVAALAVGGAAGPARMRQAPLLGLASTVSPPNSQRKLLAHLSASMRPADREVGVTANACYSIARVVAAHCFLNGSLTGCTGPHWLPWLAADEARGTADVAGSA